MEEYKKPEGEPSVPEISDSEIAVSLARSMRDPYGTGVDSPEARKLRLAYINKTKEELELLTNLEARRFLEGQIKENEEKLAQEKQEQK